MHLKRWVLAVFSILSALFLIALAIPLTPRKLSGTMIQLDAAALQRSMAAWRQDFRYMQLSGMQTVIIQYLGYDQELFLPKAKRDRDIVDTLLTLGGLSGMSLWLGLPLDSAWWSRLNDDVWLDEKVTDLLQTAGRIFRTYGTYKAFKGWYIPYESGDARFSDAEIMRLQRFYKRLADGLHALSGKSFPVGMSVFFKDAYFPEDVTRIYTRIFAQSGLDVVMVQSGVGANQWADLAPDIVPAYFEAFQKAASANHMTMWAIVEGFHLAQEGGFEPATIDEIKLQLKLATAKQYILFDFYNYMSPLKGRAQAKLFHDYMRSFFHFAADGSKGNGFNSSL